MLRFLLEEGVRFLLVGAYAMAPHGVPRATADIDPVMIDDLQIPVLSRSALLTNKRVSARPKDLLDVQTLESTVPVGTRRDLPLET